MFASVCFLLLVAVAGANLYVDPFDIFGTNFLPREKLDNERIIKIRYLSEHANQYSGYLMGSSRIGLTNPAWIEAYLPSTRLYNLSVPGSGPWDQLRHLKYLLTQGFPVTTIFLQHDIEPTYEPPPGAIYMRLHPLVTGESLWLARAKYLVTFSKDALESKLEYNFSDSPVVFDIETGHINTFVENPASFRGQFKRAQQYPAWILEKKFEDFAEFVRLCRKHNIRLYVTVTPHNHHYLDKINIEGYLFELRKLAEITGGYWDFSGYNTVTTNDGNYYEISHHRPYVARWMVEKVFAQKTASNIPDGFGQWAPAENIDFHLKQKKARMIAWDNKRNNKSRPDEGSIR